MKSEFPETVSCNRFVELQQKALMPMVVFLQLCCLGKCTGVSFIDSTPIRVCHIRRGHQHKTFKGLATKGKCSLGWFFGFKLHIVINDKGEILDFLFTQADVDDREPLKNKNSHDKIFGKLLDNIIHSMNEPAFFSPDALNIPDSGREKQKYGSSQYQPTYFSGADVS